MDADVADAARGALAIGMAADLGPRLPAAVARGRGVRQERSEILRTALLASPASARLRAGLRPARPRSHIGVIGVHLRPRSLLIQRIQCTKSTTQSRPADRQRLLDLEGAFPSCAPLGRRFLLHSG